MKSQSRNSLRQTGQLVKSLVNKSLDWFLNYSYKNRGMNLLIKSRLSVRTLMKFGSDQIYEFNCSKLRILHFQNSKYNLSKMNLSLFLSILARKKQQTKIVSKLADSEITKVMVSLFFSVLTVGVSMGLTRSQVFRKI